MSDIAILKEMIRDCAIVELEYKKEYKRDIYLLKLTENQDNYSFVISGMPEPDRVIVIKLDEFFDVRKIFTGNKGECKRADFIIIANTNSEKVILCLEMKKSRDDNSSIIKQLKGAKCFVSYCREIGREFWKQPDDFLQDYQYRFVSIKNISISKTTTSSPKFSQKSEIHDQPEKMLKISAKATHFQELI